MTRSQFDRGVPSATRSAMPRCVEGTHSYRVGSQYCTRCPHMRTEDEVAEADEIREAMYEQQRADWEAEGGGMSDLEADLTSHRPEC